MTHRIDQALADLGINPDDLDPDVLDALRTATPEPSGPPVNLDRNHPVRYLLTEASFGRQPTSDMLGRLEAMSDTLPDGHDLGRFRDKVAKAAAEVAQIRATGDHAAARRQADMHAGQLAQVMTTEEASLASLDPDPEPVDDIAARMFRA